MRDIRCHGGCTTDPMTGEVFCPWSHSWEPVCPKVADEHPTTDEEANA